MALTRSRRQVAFVSAALCAAFAMIHVAWAAGWRGGVPTEVPPIGQRPVFLTYDIVAAVVIAAGAVVFLLCTRDIRSPIWQRRLTMMLVVGSCAALVRGVPAAVIDLATALGGGRLQITGVGADVWFTVIGVGGLVVARRAASLKRATQG